ncbi:uracil phosphoribosyltransferase-domain-containing protein [Rhodocollybia butyracea]|uniref:Uracil phosphoribosyltransferase-domain-containing protein n=1 Tax=Rhodocollybia butyracea TaxID=206335 RepID=A0A9P5P587_9AGAR|nr:uracil phosphoribosyltransferase-domain-containing protein [Rhodocollybia butyracea]
MAPLQNNSPSSATNTQPTTDKPIVVGLVFLLDQLKTKLGQENFTFYEGSGVISSLVPGGLDAFRKMGGGEKEIWRERAIDKIGHDSSLSGRVAVLAGHYLFWDEKDESGELVWTDRDAATFTHILYLDIPANVIALRRQNDPERHRPSVSEGHLCRWQETERAQLRLLCLQHGILFSVVAPSEVSFIVSDFQQRSEAFNLSCAGAELDDVIREMINPAAMIVMDGDRTLIAEDTGTIFWKLASTDRMLVDAKNKEAVTCPLKALFSSPKFGYSYAAFHQTALLYGAVASMVTIHPEFVTTMKKAEKRGIGLVVITCGLRMVWEKALRNAGLSGSVKVIVGAYWDLVVTDLVKGALVHRLRHEYHIYTCVFGDSVLDLPMLKGAHQAIVVVGEGHNRSRSMETALRDAIDNEGLRARQVLLPSTAMTPRLDAVRLPVVDIVEDAFVNAIGGDQVFHATDRNAAKLLMSPMRDSEVNGPALRQAHHSVGWYLATEFLSELLGLEEYAITHVQGHQTTGHRIRYVNNTSIVALMRGGEPMALGVNEALSSAMFIHARLPADLKKHHIEGQKTVILVDSVVNNGKTVVEFVQHIRNLHPTIRIVVVAGVVQAKSLAKPEGMIAQILDKDVNFGVVALRLSDNKFTGKGTTDTGNRLFNTTHID